jgi:hypothetical protein
MEFLYIFVVVSKKQHLNIQLWQTLVFKHGPIQYNFYTKEKYHGLVRYCFIVTFNQVQ